MSLSAFESVKFSAKEVANWFTVKRAVGTTALTLALAGTVYLAEALVSNIQDETVAARLINNAGFKVKQENVTETVDGRSVAITYLEDGQCSFPSVQADLTYHDGSVVGVKNYHILPGSVIRVNSSAIIDNVASYGDTIVTVQSPEDIHRAVPNLVC